MRLIIDIPEAIYTSCKKLNELGISNRVERIIANGIPYEAKKGAENGNTDKNEGN